MPQAALSSEHLKLIDQLRQSGVQVEFEHKSSTATGPGFSGDGDTVGKFQIPGVSVNGSGVDAGRFDFSVVTPEAAMPVLIVLGGLALLGAIGLGVAKQWRSAGIVAAGGGLLIGLGVMAQSYPWLLALGALVALTGIGWFVWSEVQRHRAKADAERQHAALRAVAKAVEEDLPPEIKVKVKEAVGSRAESTREVRDTIRAVKEGA